MPLQVFFKSEKIVNFAKKINKALINFSEKARTKMLPGVFNGLWGPQYTVSPIGF